MKIFSYDPKTGKRGEQIDYLPVASWADCSVDYLISQGKMEDLGWVTADFGPGTETTIHADGGNCDRDGKSVSYRRDVWICFCTGHWGQGSHQHWEWVIIPSEQDFQAAQIQK